LLRQNEELVYVEENGTYSNCCTIKSANVAFHLAMICFLSGPGFKSQRGNQILFLCFKQYVYAAVAPLISFLTTSSRDCVVGIATGYGLDDRGVGVRVSMGSKIFSSPRRQDRLWGPPSLLSNRYRRLFSPGIKQPGREAAHLPTASAEFKKMWIYTSTPPYAFMAQEQIYLYF
jgi:hypothetical protein